MTPAEKLLWSMLRDRRLGGKKFRRQCAIGPYIADFFCREMNLVIEVDGETHDGRVEYDGQRTDYFAIQGIGVMRVANEDVISNLEAVGAAILNRMGIDPRPWLEGQYRRPPHPNPLPRGGGEGTEQEDCTRQ